MRTAPRRGIYNSHTIKVPKNIMELNEKPAPTEEIRHQQHPPPPAPAGQRSTIRKLERYINLIPSVAFNAVLQTSWASVAVSFQAGLLNGGPTSLVWGMLLSWIGTTAVAASLGEMASINPTVGAQYRWSALYAPKGLGSPAFWSLLQGWITVFAWIATMSQAPFLVGGLIQGIVILNNPGYVPERWHTTLIAWAMLILPVLGNVFARKLLVKLELVAGVLNILFFFVIVIVLGAMAPRSPASFVFGTTVTGLSGWTLPGVQWCIGLLSAAFPLQGFDGVIHLSAEIRDPTRRVPQAMVGSVVINGLFAFCFIIAILFTIGDIDTVTNTSLGYPILESKIAVKLRYRNHTADLETVFYQTTQSKAATSILTLMIIYVGTMACLSAMTSVSRLTWAFARDRGLPFSDFFSQVHPTLHVPINALMLDITVCVILLVIAIGSTTAFYAIVGLSTLALYISNIIPLLFFVMTKLRGEHIPYGPFSFNNKTLGLVVNFFALAWAVFIAIFLPFPPIVPVTGSNMNYAGPVLLAVIIWALFDWATTGRKRWKAPIDRKDMEEEERSEGGDG